MVEAVVLVIFKFSNEHLSTTMATYSVYGTQTERLLMELWERCLDMESCMKVLQGVIEGYNAEEDFPEDLEALQQFLGVLSCVLKNLKKFDRKSERLAHKYKCLFREKRVRKYVEIIGIQDVVFNLEFAWEQFLTAANFEEDEKIYIGMIRRHQLESIGEDFKLVNNSLDHIEFHIGSEGQF